MRTGHGLRALFIGGPWHDEVRIVRHVDRVIVADAGAPGRGGTYGRLGVQHGGAEVYVSDTGARLVVSTLLEAHLRGDELEAVSTYTERRLRERLIESGADPRTITANRVQGWQGRRIEVVGWSA